MKRNFSLGGIAAGTVIGSMVCLMGETYGAPGVVSVSEPVTIVMEVEEQEVLVDSSTADDTGISYCPPENYTAEAGAEYQLKSWSLVQLPGEVLETEVRREIPFEQVEASTVIPQDIVTEENQTLYLKSLELTGEGWSGDFQFPVVYHATDAGTFLLGGMEVPYQEDAPVLAGCEEELLAAAGVSPENYRIDSLVWQGGSYEDADGVLCRNALASGEKRVLDYRAVYGGTVEVQQPARWQCEAVYEPKEYERPAQVRQVAVDSNVKNTPSHQVVSEDPPRWRMLKEAFMFTLEIGLIVLGIAVFVWMIWYWRRWQKERRRIEV